MKKVEYTGDYYKAALRKGGIYEVVAVEDGMYRIFVDLYNDYFLFLPDNFRDVE